MSENIAVSFADLALSQGTLEILAQRNYTNPTPIQALVIPRLLANESDLIAQAQTGTGKTAAYALPVIEKLLESPKQKLPRAIVLAPTRELAMQIAQEVNLFVGSRELKTVTVYGGQAIDIQLRALKNGSDMIVGTPGRIIDLMERGALKLDNIQFAILDEADEMLNMGFVEDIEIILNAAPADKRMLMFSATVPPEARNIAEQFMRDARYIKAPAPEKQSIEQLTEQWACEVRREDKFNALKRILNAEGRIYAMIFCRTRADVDELTMNLQKNKFSAEALHGELTQNQRTRVIEQFKNRRFDMLVATDVAARGIDVNDLTHVINYSLPQETDIYTHRIGRTGRAGKKGVAISIFAPSEGKRFAAIRKAGNNALELRPLPDAKKIINAKKDRFRSELEKILPRVNPVYWQMAEELNETFDPLAVLAAMLDMKFHKELLPENYPALGKTKREHQFGSMHGTHRDRTPENERRPRRRDRAEAAETLGDKKFDRKKADWKKSEKTFADSNADTADNRHQDKTVSDGEKKRRRFPRESRSDKSAAVKRPKLRDWAMELADNAQTQLRRKSKKRK